MFEDPLSDKPLASIDADYFRTLLPKTTTGRNALNAAASEIEREIASIEAQQKKLLVEAIRPTRAMASAVRPNKDGTNPLAHLTGGALGATDPWDALRKTITGYDELAFSEKDRLYNEFVKQEAERTGVETSEIKMATTKSAPAEPTRTVGELGIDVLSGLGSGVTGMGKTAVDLVAPDSRVSKSLGERIDTLKSMRSPVAQNAVKEAAVDVERFKAENPDAGAAGLFGAEALAAIKNLSVADAAELAGGLSVGALPGAGAARLVAASRGLAAGAAAGTAVGATVAGASTAGEVRGDFYQQVMDLPVEDPNLQANEDFQKYLRAERDTAPSGQGAAVDDYAAQVRAKERLALDSKGAAAVAGLTSAALAVFGPEALIARGEAKRRAAQVIGGNAVPGGRVLSALDKTLIKAPLSIGSEGIDEGAPTVATNVQMQQIDPNRKVLEGAGSAVALGMVGGGLGVGADAAANQFAPTQPPAAGGTAPGAAPTAGGATPGTPVAGGPASLDNARISTATTPDGTSYSVRRFDNSVVEIPAGPDAAQQAAEMAQQADDEFNSLDTTGVAPVTLDVFNTQLVTLPDGTMDYAQDAVRNAEADAFINQLRQQATGAPATPAAPVVEPTAAPVVEPTLTPIAENLPEITLPEDVTLPERAAPMPPAPAAEPRVPGTTTLDQEAMISALSGGTRSFRVDASGLLDYMRRGELAPSESERLIANFEGTHRGVPGLTEVLRQARAIASNPTVGLNANFEGARTGTPLNFIGFRGIGDSPSDIYAGAQTPVAGQGLYIAPSPENAGEYGGEIRVENVSVQNPLVIRTDDEWRDLTRSSYWRTPNPSGVSDAEMLEYTANLQSNITGRGYDSLVIAPDRFRDTARTLRNVFGHAQIVDYRTDNRQSSAPAAPASDQMPLDRPTAEDLPAPEFASSPAVEARMQHNLSVLLESGLRANQPVTAFGTAVMRDSDGVVRYAGGAEPNPMADELIRRANETSQAAPAAQTEAAPGELTPEQQNLYQQQVANLFTSQPLTGTRTEVAARAANGVLSPELANLVTALANTNWLGYEAPIGAIRRALIDPEYTAREGSIAVNAAAAALRSQFNRTARLNTQQSAPAAEAPTFSPETEARIQREVNDLVNNPRRLPHPQVAAFDTVIYRDRQGVFRYSNDSEPNANADEVIRRANAQSQTAEVPTLTDTVAAPAVDANGIPVSGPLTTEQARRANDIVNENIYLDESRNDVRLTLDPAPVMRLAENGRSFTPELTNLLRALNNENWLGRADPAEAVQFAIGATEVPVNDLSQPVATAAQAMRAAATAYGRQRTRTAGVRVAFSQRVAPATPAAAVGARQAGVPQDPSMPITDLSLSDDLIRTFATAVRTFGRDPMPKVKPIEGNPTPEERLTFFKTTLKKLLKRKGFKIVRTDRATSAEPEKLHILSLKGGKPYIKLYRSGGTYVIGTDTQKLQAGGAEGSQYYAALYAASVAAGLAQYNGGYTNINTTRLPINRLKAVLQLSGKMALPIADIARLLGMSSLVANGPVTGDVNTFDKMARQVVSNAETHFPTASASNMTGGGGRGTYLSGVLRLKPDGTFDTPAGVMTAQELMKWTRENNQGEPRYKPREVRVNGATELKPNDSAAFGASSYSSMALAASLRSYMEATTDAQRKAVIKAIKKISMERHTNAAGVETRPFAYLDVVDPDAPPAEGRRRSPIVGDVITPSGRGYAAAIKTLKNAAATGALPEDTVKLVLALLKQNPALASDLGLSVDGTNEGAGGYNSVDKIVRLFSNANPLSGVHEILHHVERMLPAAVRAGILKAYNAALAKAMKAATPAQQEAISQLIKDASGLGGDGAKERMQQVFADRTLKYSEHYQLANPSEFWAMNAAKLFADRQGKTGWVNAARSWLQGFVQKAKSILGLPNNNAMLQGLKAVLKADGSFTTNNMFIKENGDLVPVFNDIPDGNRNTPPGTISTTGDQAAPRSREGFDELQRHIRSRTTLPAASPERALAQALNRNQVTEPGQATRAIDARLQQLGEAFHDHLGPVERLFTDIGEGSPELRSSGERVVGAMRAAPGIRDNIMRQMIEDHGGNQLFSAIEQMARTQRLTLEDATGYLGYWLTAQRAPTANARLIARDTREVERTSRLHAQAESALNTARNTAGTPVGTLNQLEADTVGAARQLAAATRQLALRTQAVNNPRASGVRRHVAGVAGFNNAQAASLAADIEQHIPREMLQQAAEHVYDLNAFRIVTDLESGRSTPEVVAQFLDNPDLQPLLQQLVEASRPDAQQEGSQANRDALRAQVMSAVRSNYVPLTGDPQTALYDESPGGGASQPNTGRTYMMEGRQDSMPDDGVTATMAGLIRSASHAGWAPFQDRVADIYEQMTPDQRNEFGIHRETRQVTDRSTGSNNSALIRLRGDTEQRFEFTDPKILDAIHNETIADTDASLSKFAKATKLYSWAATRFNLTFAPRNMVRDFGERADILLSKELRDEQGNIVPSPQVVKSMIYQGTVGLPKLLNAGVRYVLNGTAGGMSEASHYLRELQDSGNLSTFGQRFQNSRVDFIKQLKSAKTSNQRLRALNRYTLELWNTPFDFAAPLASYMAMRKNGVAKEQAQAVALELMNFRKRGTQMKTLGAAYPFAQTAVTGGVNMARSLVDARNGKLKPYAVARLTGYALTLSALRVMFMAAADDDEGGNKLAQLPDYEHENNIVIPTDNGIIKIPLPFGLMRLANGIVNNTLSYAGNEKSGRKAAGDLLMGTLIPSFAPISEAPLDGDKYPVQKFFATLAPPIFKPPLQVAMGLTPFGAPLKNEYAKEDKFISDQPKLNTPAAYTTMAQTIRQWTGVDVSPEAVRELVKGYPLGVVGYARSGLLEDKAVAEELRKPFYAPYPEAARYFQFKKAHDEASTELKKLERSEEKDAAGNLKYKAENFDAAKIKWLKDYNKQEEKIQGQISSITKSKGLSDAAKAERKEELRTKRSAAQNEALYKWRTEILKAEAKRTE